MKFKDFYNRLSALEKKEFVAAANTSLGYLYQIAFGQRPGIDTAKKFIAASKGKLKLKDLRPDLFD